MSLYTLIIVTFIVFMAINVIIGLRGRKHASTTKDFLTASGQSGIWFIIASAVGASIGSGVVIGTTQYAVKLGVAGAWYAIACGLACLVHAFVMTRFIYRNKLVSFSDYFKRRYDSNFIILLYSGIGPFACAASMGGQLVAAKAIFQAFGIDPTIGLVITAAVMLVYTMFAGLWGSYATAVFQVGVIIVGVLVVGISASIRELCAAPHADIDHQPPKKEQRNATEQMSPKCRCLRLCGRRALNRGLVDQHGKNHRANKHHPEFRRNVEEVKLLRRIECMDLRNAALCEH